ncbi:MAG: FG-GAP repeat protein, partial [Anaerolineae bacterium]|nr:FG-GAP repeat protein [Anaerolineae bacterium]
LPDVLGNVTSFALEGHSDDIMNVPLPARPETLAGSGLDAYDSATIWLEPPSPLVDDAMTVAWLGDVNGDSRADLAVGLPAANDGAGKVVIIYGAGGGWPVIPDATALSDSPSGYVGAADAGIGSVIAPAGDVNGDGLSDMLIGDPANERVFLVFGQATPNGSALSLDDEYVSNWLILTTSDNLVLGSYAAAAGDVDGDGFDDVLIGGLNASGAGKAYLLAGQATSWNATTDLATMALASYPLPGSGAPATGVGDVNSDGYDDFAISDPANSLGNGRVVSLYFGAMTPPTAAGATVTANSSAAVGAQITALGDVNGDT